MGWRRLRRRRSENAPGSTRSDRRRASSCEEARKDAGLSGRIDSMFSMNDAIRDYTARGWSIIPIRPGDKRPLVRWEDFQHRHANEAEALGWFRAWPEAGIGVVT